MTDNPKRRGRGRPPQGEQTGKTAQFTTRISPDTRDALEREAKRQERSVSQVAEALLRKGLASSVSDEDAALGSPETKAFSALIRMLMTDVEDLTEKSWRADRFTFDAAVAAISAILRDFGLAPEGAPATPHAVTEAVNELGLSRACLRPGPLGAVIAAKLWHRLRKIDEPSFAAQHQRSTHAAPFPHDYFALPAIRKTLGLAKAATAPSVGVSSQVSPEPFDADLARRQRAAAKPAVEKYKAIKAARDAANSDNDGGAK